MVSLGGYRINATTGLCGANVGKGAKRSKKAKDPHARKREECTYYNKVGTHTK